MLLRLYSIIILLLFKSGLVEAQFYYTRFGGEADDRASFITQTLDKGYLVVGETTSFGSMQKDIYVSKTETMAISGWQKHYGGMLSDVGTGAVQLSDSSYVITGYTNSFGNGGYDIYAIRIDKSGGLIWQKTYGSSDWDFGNFICKTSDGNLVICGYTFGYGNGSKDGIVIKIDENGNQIGQKIYGGPNDDELNKIIATQDGSLIAVGTTKSYGDQLGDIWLAKLSLNLDSSWFYFRGGNKKDTGKGIVQDKNGDFLVVGGSESFSSGKMDMYLFKLKKDKTIDWERNYGSVDQDEEAFDIKTSNSSFGDMIVCYTTQEISTFKKDAKVLLLSGLGFYIDGGRIGLYEDDEVFSISNAVDKGYAIAGYTRSFNAQEEDIFIIKFDSLVHGTGSLVLSNNKSNLHYRQTDEYKVQKNPFTNQLIIKTPPVNEKITTCEIKNSLGLKTHVNYEYQTNEIVFDTGHLPPGLYFLSIFTENGCSTLKVICRN